MEDDDQTPTIEVEYERDDERLEPGTRIGPYVILAQIGRGGMGQVFLGSDPRLQRKVALKCLLRSLSGANERRVQIQREARAAARVNHPNVATIHDVIEHDNRTFIVMEYVEGESLASRLRRERPATGRIVGIGRQLASALEAAHAKGVVHRDLKPANVQITPNGTAKVLDFGIANAPRIATVASNVTTARIGPEPGPKGPGLQENRPAQPGTPPYMAPEQILGHTVDERADIYSLGVVLYEMATGQRPFLDTDALERLGAQMKGAPRADVIEPSVPKPLADLIAKAMAVDVTARYQTAAEIGAALEALQRDLDDQRPPLRRRLARVAMGAALLTVVVAGVGVATTVGFQYTFGLSGPFAAQSPSMYFVWGLRALFPSAFQMTLAVLVLLGLRVVLHLVEAIGPIGRAVRRLRTWGADVAAASGLNTPSMLAQALCALALVGLGAVVWRHLALIESWGALINSYSADVLRPLGPNHMREKSVYRTELDMLLLALGFGFLTALRWRRRRRSHEATAALVLLAVTMSVIMLMSEWPYRVFYHHYHNCCERIHYAGEQCYIISSSANESQIFCPASAPPRNHVVSTGDIRRDPSRVVENVFSILDPAR
jgi:predicted Ser/Thr protein kinase